MLEKLNRGVLLLDAGGVVRFMNGAVRAMLNRGHGLSLRNRRLTFAGADATEALNACIKRASGSLLLRVGGSNHAHGAYGVLVSPLESQDKPSGFCVFIHEPPGKQRPVPAQVLRQLYGLTVAEARLANALYVGQSLQAAAGTGGISHNTAKSVLKRVFVKCEVGTQAELLQLLAFGAEDAVKNQCWREPINHWFGGCARSTVVAVSIRLERETRWRRKHRRHLRTYGVGTGRWDCWWRAHGDDDARERDHTRSRP